MKLYNKILNDVYLIQDFDSWDNTESDFKKTITDSLKTNLTYKLDEPYTIKIFDDDWDLFEDYKDKVYINGEHIELDDDGYTVKIYKPGEYHVYIEGFDELESFSEYMFYDCGQLTSIIIPGSVTKIESSVFSNCNSLISITIPDSISIIHTWTFHNCTGLTSVTIPNSVTSIGPDAFRNCTNLKKVYVENIYKFDKIKFYNDYANPTYYGAELIELKK